MGQTDDVHCVGNSTGKMEVCFEFLLLILLFLIFLLIFICESFVGSLNFTDIVLYQNYIFLGTSERDQR